MTFKTKIATLALGVTLLSSASVIAMDSANLLKIFEPQAQQIQKLQLSLIQKIQENGLSADEAAAAVKPLADDVYAAFFDTANRIYNEDELEKKLEMVDTTTGKAVAELDAIGLKIRQAYLQKLGRANVFDTVVEQMASSPVIIRGIVDKYEEDVNTKDADRIKELATILGLQEKNAGPVLAQLSLRLEDVRQQVKYLSFDASSIDNEARAAARTYVKQSKLMDKLTHVLQLAELKYDSIEVEKNIINSVALHGGLDKLKAANSFYQTQIGHDIAEKDYELSTTLNNELKPAIDTMIFKLSDKLEK